MTPTEVKKEIKNQLFKQLFSIDRVISTTIVGSFVDRDDLSGISDIDTIVICDKLDNYIFKRCITSTQKIDLKKCGLFNYSLKINSTFGPLKFDDKNTVVIHLMIYDIASHIAHVTASPFTCFDWERSNEYIGLSLKEIFPVGTLQYQDFIGARRSLSNYLEDLNHNQISYREYSFDEEKVCELKKRSPLDDRHKGEFAYHIIKNLITNYNKLITGNNISLTEKDIIKKSQKYFPKNSSNTKNLKKIIAVKLKREKIFPKYSIKLTKSFINQFERLIVEEWEDSINIVFLRHFKTDLNDGSFLGQQRNPGIKKITKEIRLNNADLVYSSPLLRSIETAKAIFNKAKIITDKRLTEIDYGLAEGINYNQLSIKFPDIVKCWNEGKDMRFPNGESTIDVLNRLKSFLDFLKKDLIKKKRREICIITHNVVLRCLIGSYYNLNENLWHKLDIPHGIFFEFKFKNGKFFPNINRNILKKIKMNISYKIK
jgi:ribonuclease H / adenosylcobalamin/alpha-ribazole phosphatase